MSALNRTRWIFIGILGLTFLILSILIILDLPDPLDPPSPTETSVAEAPRNAVEIEILTADTKAEWVRIVTESFNSAGVEISSGKPIFVTVVGEGSPGDAQQAVLEGNLKPTVWSPGDMSWVEVANQISQDRGQQPLVTKECPSIVFAATGFGMWRPMAEAMGWPDEPIGWDEIVELAADPAGWSRYDHSEWGQFKFGHAHPEHSNTGFSMMATLAYSALNSTSGLDPEKVKSDEVIKAFRKVEFNTYHYGLSTSGLLILMAKRGPSYLHAVTASETAVLKTNEVFKDTMRFPYVFIFPTEGTFWSDNPYCILETDWVSDEQREAAQIYLDYLLQPEQQDMAVTIGLRPVNSDVTLHDPISLDFGTDPRVNPENVPALEGVSGEAAAAIIDVFKQTKKKATIIVALDTSGSMGGRKLTNAVDGTTNFITRLSRDDELIIYVFSDSVQKLRPSGFKGEVVEHLSDILQGLYAEGSTTLYDSICQAAETIDGLQAGHEAENEKRLYGIVVLSDGKDTASVRTESDLFNCLPSGEEVEGVKVFTIAYGEDADQDLLLRIANRTNGKMHIGDPDTIDQIYLAISSEQ